MDLCAQMAARALARRPAAVLRHALFAGFPQAAAAATAAAGSSGGSSGAAAAVSDDVAAEAAACAGLQPLDAVQSWRRTLFSYALLNINAESPPAASPAPNPAAGARPSPPPTPTLRPCPAVAPSGGARTERAARCPTPYTAAAAAEGAAPVIPPAACAAAALAAAAAIIRLASACRSSTAQRRCQLSTLARGAFSSGCGELRTARGCLESSVPLGVHALIRPSVSISSRIKLRLAIILRRLLAEQLLHAMADGNDCCACCSCSMAQCGRS